MIDGYLLAEENRLLAVEMLSQLFQKPECFSLGTTGTTVIHIAPNYQFSLSMLKNRLLILTLNEPQNLNPIDLC